MNSGRLVNYPLSSPSSLYVGDLHPDINESILFSKFATVGPVFSIRVCRDIATGRSLGYAYINYRQETDAEKALSLLNFDILKGRPMRIMWSQRDPTLRSSGIGNIIIKNLDKKVDSKALYDLFFIYGGILSCKVVQDESGMSKGYGFVHFEAEKSANRAIQKVNGMLLNGKKVFVEKFMSRKERERKTGSRIRFITNVYVKNLGGDVSDEQLRNMFSIFGNIRSYKIIRDESGNSKCFGFVCFSTQEEANKAVANMNGRVLGRKPLYVAVAQRKFEYEASFATRQMQQINPSLSSVTYRPGFYSPMHRPINARACVTRPAMRASFGNIEESAKAIQQIGQTAQNIARPILGNQKHL